MAGVAPTMARCLLVLAMLAVVLEAYLAAAYEVKGNGGGKRSPAAGGTEKAKRQRPPTSTEWEDLPGVSVGNQDEDDDDEDVLGDGFLHMEDQEGYYSHMEKGEIKSLERWFELESTELTDMLTKVIFKKQTKYQNIEIIDAGRHGKSLVLDGMLQSSEADEFLYHEGLVQPAMILHPNPKRVFIGGGGEGATSREVLKHHSVEKVVMVDLDEECVEICKVHLPEHHMGSFDDPRHELVVASAIDYLKSYDGEPFDVAILDFPDPVRGSPAYHLFTTEFYQLVKNVMAPQGLVVTQSGLVNLDDLPDFATIYRTMRTVFPHAQGYAVPLPVFSDMHGFMIASMDKKLKFNTLSGSDITRRIQERTNNTLRYLSVKTFTRMIKMPSGVKKEFQIEDRIFRDSDSQAEESDW